MERLLFVYFLCDEQIFKSYLFEKQSKWEWRRDTREIFHLLFHSSDAPNSQGCSRLKPGAWNSTQVSHGSGRHPNTLGILHCLFSVLAGSQVRSGGRGGTPSQALGFEVRAFREACDATNVCPLMFNIHQVRFSFTASTRETCLGPLFFDACAVSIYVR